MDCRVEPGNDVVYFPRYPHARAVAADFRAGRGPVEAAERQLDRIGRLGLRSHESG